MSPERRHKKPASLQQLGEAVPSGMVRLGVIRGFENIVRRNGGDPDRVIATAGLHEAASGALDSLITLDAYSSFLAAAAEEARLPTFSIEFGQNFDTRNLGAIGYLFELAPDLGTAIHDFCENFEVVQDNTEIGLEVQGDIARVVYSVRDGTRDKKAQDAEFSVAMLGAVFDGEPTRSKQIRRVDLEHRPRWNWHAAAALLGDDIRSDARRNAVYLERRALEHPGGAANGFLYGLVLSHVRDELRQRRASRHFTNAVTEALGAWFRTGRPERAVAAVIAAELGISERTLHRRLALHGTNFRALRNGVVLDRGAALLSSSDFSVTEIALHLGFSETSAFSRAFRLLSGRTPVDYRRSLGGSAGQSFGSTLEQLRRRH